MADHILERQNNDEPPPPVVSRPQAVRISPVSAYSSLPAQMMGCSSNVWSQRKVLESLSTLRIEITRVILLEAESCKRGASADVIPAMLTPDGAGEPANLILSQHVAIKKLKLDCDTDDVRVLAVSGGVAEWSRALNGSPNDGLALSASPTRRLCSTASLTRTLSKLSAS